MNYKSTSQRQLILTMLLLVGSWLFIQPVYAQTNSQVTGVVQDDKKEILVGVSVKAERKNTAFSATTLTNDKGIFTFSQLPAGGPYDFTFSYVGFEGHTLRNYIIKENNKISLTINLQSTAAALNEVVVVGYGTQKKINLTGAVDQVGSEVFENRPITNIAQGLQGAIPNLNISFGDGQIGRGGNFNIRGFTSVNGGGPLILIDGTPGDINLVSPEDVENVTVLKDAASAAIYGARAAFGVILVTTRRAKKDRMQVRYTNNFGYSNPTRLPQVMKDPLEAAILQNEAYKGFAGSDQPGMPVVIDYLRKRQADPSLPELGVDASGNYIRGAATDWYKEFYNERQPFSKNFISISGSKGNTNYYLSLGHQKQKGMFKVATDDYERYNFRLKIDNQFTDWFRLFNNTEFIEGIYDAPNKFVSGGFNVYRYLSLFANPYEAIKTPNGNYTQAGMLTFGQLEKAGRSINRDRLLKNTLGFHTNFFKNSLRVNGDFTVFVRQDMDNIQNIRLQYENRPNQLVTSSNPDFYSSSFAENFNTVLNLYSEYEKRFSRHHVKGLIGFNQETNKFNSFSSRRDENITPTLGAISLTTGIPTVADRKSEWALRGIFGRLNYDFNDRYLLEINGRYDGTSRFQQSHRFGFFPSVSAGWIISHEDFFNPLSKAINNLKIRGSYGSLGNQLVSDYAYYTTMGVYKATDIVDGVQPLAIRAPALSPNNLTWETSTTFDLGIDVSAFKNRFTTTFDWYDRKTTNMLTKGRTLPSVLGTGEPRENAADLSTKGWELSIGWNDNTNLLKKPFSYNVSLVLSDNRSVITRFDNPNKFLGDYYVGQEIGELWGYHTLGFFQNDDEYKTHADQKNVQSIVYALNGHPLAGDIKFEDRNNDKLINNGQNTADNPGDMYKIGNSTPRYAYGFNAGFNWNGITLNVFLQGIGKRDFWPGSEAGIFWGFYNRWNQPVYDHIVGNFWTPEKPDAYFPRLRAYTALFGNRELGVQQTRYLQNAAYLRVKEVTVGYTIPVKWTKQVSLSNARIFFSGQNLHEFTKLSKVFDPEGITDEADSPTRNGNGYVYPFQRTYTFGLELNF